MNSRKSGILLHISSLPNKYGIGTFGKSAYDFVDFLQEAKQKYWQVLPLGQTSYGDSPYQTFSAFAGNPYFIDYDLLKKDGLLKASDYSKYKTTSVNVEYDYIYKTKYEVLKKAYSRFDIKNDQFVNFVNDNSYWLDDYSLFMVLKQMHQGVSFIKWDEKYKYRDTKALQDIINNEQNQINYWKFIQFIFFKQWSSLKKYANDKGILIIGDMPIYVALDSVDVWSNPSMFKLDEDLVPSVVAGVPPDAFSEDGQLWGNPIYRYDVMQKDGYKWWIRRIKHSLNISDIVRIDHFRGFEAYFEIKAEATTAKGGHWVKGPNTLLFDQIKAELGDVSIIAEDLGYLTKEVHEMLEKTKYPGMKVLQFAFTANANSDYLPHNHVKNCIVYTGTHDNTTTKDYFESLNPADKEFCKTYLGFTNDKDAVSKLIQAAFSSVANTVIIPMQDYLELGREGRLNTPSVLGGNWVWRMKATDINQKLATKIKKYVTTYYR